jgi:hypothetical protein
MNKDEDGGKPKPKLPGRMSKQGTDALVKQIVAGNKVDNRLNELDKDEKRKSGNPVTSLVNKARVVLGEHRLASDYQDLWAANAKYARYEANDNSNIHRDFGSIGSATGKK